MRLIRNAFLNNASKCKTLWDTCQTLIGVIFYKILKNHEDYTSEIL